MLLLFLIQADDDKWWGKRQLYLHRDVRELDVSTVVKKLHFWQNCPYQNFWRNYLQATQRPCFCTRCTRKECIRCRKTSIKASLKQTTTTHTHRYIKVLFEVCGVLSLKGEKKVKWRGRIRCASIKRHKKTTSSCKENIQSKFVAFSL